MASLQGVLEDVKKPQKLQGVSVLSGVFAYLALHQTEGKKSAFNLEDCFRTAFNESLIDACAILLLDDQGIMAADTTYSIDTGSTENPLTTSVPDGPNSKCEGSVLWINFFHYSVIPAILIIVLLSFLEKRKDERMKSFYKWNRFAFIYPINLIDHQENRFAYALAFGATATLVLDIFSGSFSLYYDATSTEPWVKILLGAVGTVEVAVDCYPMFACIRSRNRLVGSIFGFLYTTLWFSFQLASVILCPTVKRGLTVSYEPVLGEIPTLLCWFFLMLKFAQEFVRIVIERVQGRKATLVEKFMRTTEAIYVKHLLRRKKEDDVIKPEPKKDEEEAAGEKPWLELEAGQTVPEFKTSDGERSSTESNSYMETSSACECNKVAHTKYRIISRIEKKFYEHYDVVPGFVYPTRLICTFTVAIICQYQLGIVFFRDGSMALTRLFGTVDDALGIAKVQFDWTNEQYEQALKLADGYEVAANVCWWIASSIAVILSLMMVAHTFLCYRKHMLRMYSGNRIFLPRAKLSSAECVAGNLQYCGYQIAYYLSGYAILQGLVFFLIYLFTGGVVLPFIHYTLKTWLVIINTIIPLVVVLFIVFASQQILANKYFLQERINPDDSAKPLALQHREGFHNVAYFLVFLNVLVGVVAALIRVLTSLFLGLALVMRIDRPILMRGFEKYDKSYKAYVGNLMFLNQHSHPVLVTFCRILYYQMLYRKKIREKRAFSRSTSVDCSDIPGLYGVTTTTQSVTTVMMPLSRPIKRWQVAYTLIFNPKLIETRKKSSSISFVGLEDVLSRKHKVSTLRRHRNQVLLRSSMGFKRTEIDNLMKQVEGSNLSPAVIARWSHNIKEEDDESSDDPTHSGSNDSMTELVGRRPSNTTYGSMDQGRKTGTM